MIYGSETSPVKEKEKIRLERNNSRTGRLMLSVGPKDRIFAEKLRIRQRSNRMRERLQDRRLQWYSFLEKWKRESQQGCS